MSVVAIIGASVKPERPSHEAVVRYRARGWTVYPVHPSGLAVAGVPTLRKLSEVPEQPDIISMYVNGQAGLAMLDEIVASGCKRLWLNPGADDPALAQAARARGLQVIIACNLVALGYGDPLEVLKTLPGAQA